MKTQLSIPLFGLLAIFEQSANAQAIIHDAEHYLLQFQNAKQWAADDRRTNN